MAPESTNRRTQDGRAELALALSLILTFFTGPLYAQNLGDLARQERERKTNDSAAKPHVYTNEDLAKAKILAPEDEKRLESKQVAQPVTQPSTDPSAQPAPQFSMEPMPQPLTQPFAQPGPQFPAQALAQPAMALPVNLAPLAELPAVAAQPVAPVVNDAADQTYNDSLPLGDIARRYRALKEEAQNSRARVNAPWQALNLPLPGTVKSHSLADYARPVINSPYPLGAIPNIGTDAQPAPPLSFAPQVSVKTPNVKVPVERITDSARIQVRAGDTLWSLAKKYLGRGEEWVLLAMENALGDPNHIRTGMWLRLPQDILPSDANAPKRVRVAPGDTLWKLSREYLGDGYAWQCMAHANPSIKNSDVILSGQMLTVPSDCGRQHATATVAGVVPQE
jgi:LysM repeat protein